MAMQVGDRGFFIHSTRTKAIVGIVEVIEPYTLTTPTKPANSGMFDVRAVKALKNK